MTTMTTMTMMTKLAAQLGVLSGIQASMPSDKTFEKVASSLHMDPKFVKLAYLHKQAHPALLLGLGGLAAGGLGVGAGMAGAAAWPKVKGLLDPTPEMTRREREIQSNMRRNMVQKNMMQMEQASNNPGAGMPNPYQLGTQ